MSLAPEAQSATFGQRYARGTGHGVRTGDLKLVQGFSHCGVSKAASQSSCRGRYPHVPKLRWVPRRVSCQLVLRPGASPSLRNGGPFHRSIGSVRVLGVGDGIKPPPPKPAARGPLYSGWATEIDRGRGRPSSRVHRNPPRKREKSLSCLVLASRPLSCQPVMLSARVRSLTCLKTIYKKGIYCGDIDR